MKDEGKKWAKGKYPFTSAGLMRRFLTTGVTVLFPVSNNFITQCSPTIAACLLLSFRIPTLHHASKTSQAYPPSLPIELLARAYSHHVCSPTELQISMFIPSTLVSPESIYSWILLAVSLSRLYHLAVSLLNPPGYVTPGCSWLCHSRILLPMPLLLLKASTAWS